MSPDTSFKKHGNIRSSILICTVESPKKILKYAAEAEKHETMIVQVLSISKTFNTEKYFQTVCLKMNYNKKILVSPKFFPNKN